MGGLLLCNRGGAAATSSRLLTLWSSRGEFPSLPLHLLPVRVGVAGDVTAFAASPSPAALCVCVCMCRARGSVRNFFSPNLRRVTVVMVMAVGGERGRGLS